MGGLSNYDICSGGFNSCVGYFFCIFGGTISVRINASVFLCDYETAVVIPSFPPD